MTDWRRLEWKWIVSTHSPWQGIVYQWNRAAKVQHATCQLLSAFPDIQNEEAQVIKTLGMNFGTNSVINYSDM